MPVPSAQSSRSRNWTRWHSEVRNAEEEAVDEVWASYRFVSLYDSQTETKIRTIDLGAGYATGNESLTGRVVSHP